MVYKIGHSSSLYFMNVKISGAVIQPHELSIMRLLPESLNQALGPK